MDLFKLPQPLLLKVLEHLHTRDVVSLAQVSRTFHDLVYTTELPAWESISANLNSKQAMHGFTRVLNRVSCWVVSLDIVFTGVKWWTRPHPDMLVLPCLNRLTVKVISNHWWSFDRFVMHAPNVDMLSLKGSMVLSVGGSLARQLRSSVSCLEVDNYGLWSLLERCKMQRFENLRTIKCEFPSIVMSHVLDSMRSELSQLRTLTHLHIALVSQYAKIGSLFEKATFRLQKLRLAFVLVSDDRLDSLIDHHPLHTVSFADVGGITAHDVYRMVRKPSMRNMAIECGKWVADLFEPDEFKGCSLELFVVVAKCRGEREVRVWRKESFDGGWKIWAKDNCEGCAEHDYFCVGCWSEIRQATGESCCIRKMLDSTLK